MACPPSYCEPGMFNRDGSMKTLCMLNLIDVPFCFIRWFHIPLLNAKENINKYFPQSKNHISRALNILQIAMNKQGNVYNSGKTQCIDVHNSPKINVKAVIKKKDDHLCNMLAFQNVDRVPVTGCNAYQIVLGKRQNIRLHVLGSTALQRNLHSNNAERKESKTRIMAAVLAMTVKG